MAGTVIVPWYATGLRAEKFEPALGEVSAIALRYDATSHHVYRARDDRYKFQQVLAWDEHEDWERYWEGPEMTYFRARYSGWYQVPVLYGWWDLTAYGQVAPERVTANGAGNGVAAGESA